MQLLSLLYSFSWFLSSSLLSRCKWSAPILLITLCTSKWRINSVILSLCLFLSPEEKRRPSLGAASSICRWSRLAQLHLTNSPLWLELNPTLKGRFSALRMLLWSIPVVIICSIVFVLFFVKQGVHPGCEAVTAQSSSHYFISVGRHYACVRSAMVWFALVRTTTFSPCWIFAVTHPWKSCRHCARGLIGFLRPWSLLILVNLMFCCSHTVSWHLEEGGFGKYMEATVTRSWPRPWRVTQIHLPRWSSPCAMTLLAH